MSGEQAHVLFEDGVTLGLPVIAEDAINQALRFFASTLSHHDGFGAVALWRVRNTDD